MIELLSHESGITTFVGQGSITARELAAAYAQFVANAPTSRVLWDLSSATLAYVDAEDIRKLARDLTEIGKMRRLSGKSAVLCGRQVDFGMARMLQTYLELEGYGVNVAAFVDRNRALQWLGEGSD
jgi:hypothetical protein